MQRRASSELTCGLDAAVDDHEPSVVRKDCALRERCGNQHDKDERRQGTHDSASTASEEPSARQGEPQKADEERQSHHTELETGIEVGVQGGARHSPAGGGEQEERVSLRRLAPLETDLVRYSAPKVIAAITAQTPTGCDCREVPE